MSRSRDVFFRGAFHGLEIPLTIQVDHQPVAVTPVRSRGEAARADGFLEIEHHPKLSARPQPGTDRLYGSGVLRQLLQALRQPAVLQVHDQAIGSAQGEDIVFGGPAQVEDDAGSSILGPYTDVLDLRGRLGRHGEQQQ